MTQPKTQRFAKAITNGATDRSWSISRESVQTDPSTPDARDTFIHGILHDKSGKELLSFLIAKRNTSHTLLQTAFFAGRISGHDVSLCDIDRDPQIGEAKVDTMNQPDGRISDGDTFLINRIEYTIADMSNISNHRGTRGIFIVESTGPRWANTGGKPLPTPYHGIMLKKDQNGEWAFHGPSKRSGAGERLAQILNDLQGKYSKALEDAEKHIK